MNRRIFLKFSALTGALLTVPVALLRAASGQVGKYELAEFKAITKSGGAKVAAIKPSPAPLSKADEKLMMEVAAGGNMQLELSRLAIKQAASPDVKAYAMAEAEEQEGLAMKLKEISAAKGMTMPKAISEKQEKELAKLEKLSGAEFDKAYLKNGGIAGHKMLQTTMEKVESKAEDATLKELAMTALPLIKVHLQAAEDEIKDEA